MLQSNSIAQPTASPITKCTLHATHSLALSHTTRDIQYSIFNTWHSIFNAPCAIVDVELLNVELFCIPDSNLWPAILYSAWWFAFGIAAVFAPHPVVLKIEDYDGWCKHSVVFHGYVFDAARVPCGLPGWTRWRSGSSTLRCYEGSRWNRSIRSCLSRQSIMLEVGWERLQRLQSAFFQWLLPAEEVEACGSDVGDLWRLHQKKCKENEMKWRPATAHASSVPDEMQSASSKCHMQDVVFIFSF
jgi:hypothetical protein